MGTFSAANAALLSTNAASYVAPAVIVPTGVEVVQERSGSEDTNEIELLLGPYRSGKTSLLIEQLIAVKQANPLARVLVLVPSARYGRILKQRIGLRLRHSVNTTNKGSKKNSGIFGLEIQPF